MGASRTPRSRRTPEAAPIPPLVASPDTDREVCERLTATLVDAHRAPEIAATLADLLLARFEPVAADVFEVLLERRRAAEQAGYPGRA